MPGPALLLLRLGGMLRVLRRVRRRAPSSVSTPQHTPHVAACACALPRWVRRPPTPRSCPQVIEPVRSRCLCIRVAAPSVEVVAGQLQHVAAREKLSLPDALAQRLAAGCDRNLRRALLSLEACRVQQYPFREDQEVVEPDWELYIKVRRGWHRLGGGAGGMGGEGGRTPGRLPRPRTVRLRGCCPLAQHRGLRRPVGVCMAAQCGARRAGKAGAAWAPMPHRQQLRSRQV